MDCRAPAPSCDLSTLDYAVALLRVGVLSIDEHGQIWREKRWSPHRQCWEVQKPRLADRKNTKGYMRLRFKRNKKVVSVMSQRVSYTFHHGPIPEDRPQVNHSDLVRDNNRPENLSAVTQSENIRHSYDHRMPPTMVDDPGGWLSEDHFF